MVFRKPFAFIIKHFKAFHIVMFLTSLFVMYNANQVRGLARSLISSNAFTYTGAESYARSPVYIICLIGLVAVGLIYWLFKVRKKDLRYYRLVLIYYIASMSGFYYLSDKLIKLSEAELSMDELGLLRDVSTMILMASVPIIVLSLIRGIGFNIKQFNFSKDIKELEITDNDSEEFEILIGQNNYKYIRKIRKMIRETRYVVLEHLFLIIIVGTALLVVGGISIGYKIYKENKSVGQQEITTVNGVYYAVNKTYITARDLNGKQIKSNYKYVVVNISMKNLNEEDVLFNQEIFSLQSGRLVYKPIDYFQNVFNDLGVFIQNGTQIPKDNFLTGLIVFEIPNSMKVTNFKLKVFRDLNITDEDFSVNYEAFAANGYLLDDEKKEEIVNIGTKYDSSIYKDNKVSFTINKAYLQDAYSDKYIICETEDKCSKKSLLVKPDSLTTSTMLIVDYQGSLNSDANYYYSIKDMDEFFNSFTKVEYTVGIDKYTSTGGVLYKGLNGKAFIVVDRKITRASSIDLVFNFRNTTIKVPIK